ncbi:biopolymer transporter ExbD [Aureispira sp. CCB-QB1]|uniref:ExbD/TolR family protein n=1 Tax=Aureispira sp. CCB-QB1 TaxID=1313421 RepID=UPI000698E8B1|nr:biopolymer transporter ExbD [Aureispira sp. CCB-QB1]
MKKTKKKMVPVVSAGSLADVAFLLLIFFLVTTTIQTDTGLNVLLPAWTEDIVKQNYENRNVLSVHINFKNELMIEGERAQLSDLQSRTEQLILKEAESPKKAIVSLQNDHGTSYETYVAVYNEIKAGYNHIWDNESLRRFGQHYDDLDKKSQAAVRKNYPLVISEVESSTIAINQ